MQSQILCTLPPIFDSEGAVANPKPGPEPVVIVSGPLAWITHKLGIQPWGQVLILTLLACGFFLNSKLNKIDDHLVQNDKDIAKLPLEMSKELLSQAETDIRFGRTEAALRVLDSANAFLIKAAVKKIPASPEYFEDALNSMSAMRTDSRDEQVLTTLHRSSILLAGYRSSLEPTPAKREDQKTIDGSVGSTWVSETADKAKRTVLNVRFANCVSDNVGAVKD